MKSLATGKIRVSRQIALQYKISSLIFAEKKFFFFENNYLIKLDYMTNKGTIQ